MVDQLRRIVPRQLADWEGTYLVESDPERRWRDCRVIDISSAGAGLELEDAPDVASPGNIVYVAVHLRGEIRNTQPLNGDRLRVGVQFVDLSSRERTYLRSLEAIDARW
jgi:hypothetical protein